MKLVHIGIPFRFALILLLALILVPLAAIGWLWFPEAIPAPWEFNWELRRHYILTGEIL